MVPPKGPLVSVKELKEIINAYAWEVHGLDIDGPVREKFSDPAPAEGSLIVIKEWPE